MKLCSPLLISLAALLSLVKPVLAEPVAPPADAKKFEIYLLVGQSNMAGRGQPGKEDKQASPNILVLNKNNEWVSQGDPIHFDKGSAGVGPGMPFARLMAEAHPDVVIGLIPCAVGGTPISRWQPKQDLFEAAVARAQIAMKAGTLKGILWHQGESECGDEAKAKAYGKDLSEVVKGFRTALNAPNVPFVAGELGEYLYTRTGNKSPFAKEVNEQIGGLPKHVPNTAVATSEGLGHKGDELHFSTDAQHELGKRYFEQMEKLTAAKK